MGQCWELVALGPVACTSFNHSTGEVSHQQYGFCFIVPEEADDAIFKLTKPYGTVNWLFRCGQAAHSVEEIPWAQIALDREYCLVGNFLKAKGHDSRILYSWYSWDGEDIPLSQHKISHIAIMKKQALQKIADRTPLLHEAWKLLKDKPEDRRWFCICDPLPKYWAIENERRDADQLPINYLGRSA